MSYRLSLARLSAIVGIVLGVALLTFSMVGTASATKKASPKKPPAANTYRCTIHGTAADDVIVGTKGRDIICGYDGDDVIDGLDGDDVIYGGRGDDTINGGEGKDRIEGNWGVDHCDGGPAWDWVDCEPIPDGMVIVPSEFTYAKTLKSIERIVSSNPNLRLVKTIDHRAGAASRGLTLRPTAVVIFGNPRLGTPLMQSNQTVGIDLPQKLLVYVRHDGITRVAYNDPSYLKARHGLSGDAAEASLTTVTAALGNITKGATGQTRVPPPGPHRRIKLGDGLVEVPSSNSVAVTTQRLVDSIAAAPALNLTLHVDHSGNAASVGLTLRPTSLTIFGNPLLGTPLMQQNQLLGIDLPQKILIYEKANGQVVITYNDPQYLAARHRVAADSPQLATIAGALANLSANAGAPPA